MTQPISPEQWQAFRAQGHTDAQIMSHFHINPTPMLPGPPPPAPAHAPRGSIDDLTGDEAVFRHPKLPAGTRLVTVLEIEGPVATNYGDAVFVGVCDEHGDKYRIKHKHGTAIEQNIARQSLACLVAACGARSLSELRKGCARQVRVNAVEAVAKNGQPYIRVDYLSASAPVPSSAPTASAPALTMPPMPGAPAMPAMPAMPTAPAAALPTMPPPGWMGAWPP
jgi:hypothetical protein